MGVVRDKKLLTRDKTHQLKLLHSNIRRELVDLESHSGLAASPREQADSGFSAEAPASPCCYCRKDFTGRDALFLSIDPGAIGDSGCDLIADIRDPATGPLVLGRVVRLPRILWSPMKRLGRLRTPRS